MQQNQEHLLQLIYAKENQEFQEIKKRFSEHTKYFFNFRRNITIVYDRPIVYVIHKEYLKIIDLRKNFIITDLVYNYKKNILLFLTAQGHLYAYFATNKLLVEIKKDYKKVFMMEWIYSSQQLVHFFVAEEGGIYLYKIEEEKKGIKEVKHLSGRYHCFLYEPLSQFLAGFQYGDCDVAYIFHFIPLREKNWFRCGEIQVSFADDEMMAQRIKSKKRLGLEGNRIGKQIFTKRKQSQDYIIDIQNLHNTPYLFFYYSNEGKLQLTPLSQSSDKKQVTIKLPSDSPPSFNVFDNMLIVHLKNQKITFIYDINATSFQPLVSPYPLTHEKQQLNPQIYACQFINKRVLLPNGHISKWKINLSVIYHYLKNQMQIFDFLTRRTNSKIQTLRWMRQGLFNFKQLNLSKMWKTIFAKIDSGMFDESEIVSMIEVYTNLFYTLSIEPQVDKEKLVNILMECLRQANQYHIIVPDELQFFTTDILLSTQKYELLGYLCHHNIIKNDLKIFRMIYEMGQKQNNELLVTLSIDLAYQNSSPKDVLRLIMKSQRLKEGKRYIKSNFEKLEALDILQSAKYVKNIDAKREFVSYLRAFISFNFSSINVAILNEAQKRLFS